MRAACNHLMFDVLNDDGKNTGDQACARCDLYVLGRRQHQKKPAR